MEENPKPRRRWSQFSLRRMFMAITWVSLFCASLVLVARVHRHELVAREWELIAILFITPLPVVPIPALIGVLAGRPKTGFFLGLGIWLAGIVYLKVLIDSFFANL